MTEVKYIRPELIEAIARNTLKNYDASLILGYEAKSVPIEDIIESMGLSLEFQYIRKNGTAESSEKPYSMMTTFPSTIWTKSGMS